MTDSFVMIYVYNLNYVWHSCDINDFASHLFGGSKTFLVNSTSHLFATISTIS